MENNINKIATIVNQEDVESFLQKLKKNGFLIYEEISENGSLIVEYKPSFVKDDRRYDMIARMSNELILVDLLKDNVRILTNLEFQEFFIKTKNLLIALSVEEKEEIQKKADELNLAISDLLYFVGSNIKGLENSEMALINKRKDSKGTKKTTISIRVNTRDKELFMEKATLYGMNLSEFFIVSALNFDIKLVIKK